MAKKIAPVVRVAQAKQPVRFDPKLKSEVAERLADARAQKQMSAADIRECYFFEAPRRIRTADSQSSSNTKPGDQNELQTTLGYEVAEDFLEMLVDSFTPQQMNWAEQGLGQLKIPNGTDVEGLKKQIKQQDDDVFGEIRASNFHSELGKTGNPDAAIGVWAMHIHSPNAFQPVHCQGIPIRELEINLGPNGTIDDRFVVRKTKNRHVPALLAGIELPYDIAQQVLLNPKADTEIVWSYWRDWSNVGTEAWHHRITVGGELAHVTMLLGSGSCPLVVARFGSSPDFAWPEGPSIKSLPDFRTHDEMCAAKIENVDFTLRPPFGYPDDGILNLSAGVEPGTAYPMRPGTTHNPFPKMWEPNPLSPAQLEMQDTERRVKRLHYVDFPEQRGKTPPTASQWLDEMVKAQKRIGTPGDAYWREGPYETFRRFLFLAFKRGTTVPIQLNGQTITLTAYNPAKRAQENQDVLTATRFMQIGGSGFPQFWQVNVNAGATLKNIKDKLGDKLVVLNEQGQEMESAVKTLQALGGSFGTQLPGGLAGAANPGSGTP